MVADRHHRDDLAAVEKQGQRPLHDDGRRDRAAFVVDAGDGAGQPRVVGLRTDGEFLHEWMMGWAGFRFKASDVILKRRRRLKV